MCVTGSSCETVAPFILGVNLGRKRKGETIGSQVVADIISPHVRPVNSFLLPFTADSIKWPGVTIERHEFHLLPDHMKRQRNDRRTVIKVKMVFGVKGGKVRTSE